MIAQSSSRLQYIAEILDSSKPLMTSKLVHLSDLNTSELNFLKEFWAKTDAARRHQIISQLIHLSSIDVRLDFSSVFIFCRHDPDEEIRAKAITGLETEENHRLINPLIQCLKEDSSSKVRAAAAIILGKFALLSEQGCLPAHFRNQIYSALLDALSSNTETAEVKRRALEAISPFNLPQVKDLIEQGYRTNDIKLKASSLYAMGRNCDPAWLPILLTELNSTEAEIRYQAATACGELGDEKAVPYLLELLDDDDKQVQEAAIKALGQIGGEQAKQALKRLGKNRQPKIREAAKSALKEILFCEDPLSQEL